MTVSATTRWRKVLIQCLVPVMMSGPFELCVTSIKLKSFFHLCVLSEIL